MINTRTLKQKIHLLEYIQKTLKSVESININKKNILKKQEISWNNLNITLWEIINIININIPCNPNKALLIIGSDNSLCGSYNNSIIKYVNNMNIKFSEYKTIIIIGKKIKKLSINHNNIIYYDYKNFFNNENIYNFYYEFNFSLDILGYHNKNITIKSLLMENISYKSLPIKDYIIEGNIEKSLIELYFYKQLFYTIYTIECQENIQRLIFLKSALDNCENEIKYNIQQYRTVRQEQITKELNELIASNSV